MRPVRLGRVFFAFLALTFPSATLLSTYPVLAQPAGAARDVTDTRDKYIGLLEARIRKLEKEQDRVSALEKKIDALSSELATRNVAGAPADPKRTASADKR